MTVAKALPKDLIDSLLAGYKKPEDLIGEQGLLKQLTKALVERALEAEMEAHLGHAKNEAVTNSTRNTRNGKSSKTLKGEFGELPVEIPRDRHGSFEPQLIPKHQTRWTGFDDKILSLYARGMTVREIQSHLEEMYGTEVSPSLISSVTDAVADEVKMWQSRPLDGLYPIVYMDCRYSMSCANTNLPECMMRNRAENRPVSQKIQFQIGDTPEHAVSYSKTMSYLTVLAKLPDTTDIAYKIFIIATVILRS